MLRKPSSPSSRPSRPQPTWLRLVEITLEAANVLVWPLLALVILIVFIDPIERIASGLATKLEQADKVSFGSLSLEIAQKAREAGSPELAAQVGSLTPAAIEQLLLTPRSGDVILMSTNSHRPSMLGLPKKVRIDALVELSSQGFIRFREDIAQFLADLRRLPIESGSKSSDHEYYVVPGGPESSAYKRFRDQGYTMTAKGRVAGEAVVKAVTAQLGP